MQPYVIRRLSRAVHARLCCCSVLTTACSHCISAGGTFKLADLWRKLHQSSIPNVPPSVISIVFCATNGNRFVITFVTEAQDSRLFSSFVTDFMHKEFWAHGFTAENGGFLLDVFYFCMQKNKIMEYLYIRAVVILKRRLTCNMYHHSLTYTLTLSYWYFGIWRLFVMTVWYEN